MVFGQTVSVDFSLTNATKIKEELAHFSGPKRLAPMAQQSLAGS